jgi:hypothetical protein
MKKPPAPRGLTVSRGLSVNSIDRYDRKRNAALAGQARSRLDALRAEALLR